jgi:glucose dehydrogenase
MLRLVPVLWADGLLCLICSVAGGQQRAAARSKPASSSRAPKNVEHADRATYGGDPQDDRYSPLRQINRSNVKQLKIAWTLDTGEEGALQTNPLIVRRMLHGFTPTQKVIALDAATGEEIWRFDNATPGLQPTRGLTYWAAEQQKILFASLLSYLYALNPKTGKPITSFGDRGRIDLRNDLDKKNVKASFAAMTSPA